MAKYRHLQVNTVNGVVVVRFVDAWATTDLAKGGLRTEMLALVAQEDCSKLLLNCAGLTYVSSTMLGNLISLHKAVTAAGGKLTLCELTPTVKETIALMKLEDLLDIRGTESEGLASFE